MKPIFEREHALADAVVKVGHVAVPQLEAQPFGRRAPVRESDREEQPPVELPLAANGAPVRVSPRCLLRCLLWCPGACRVVPWDSFIPTYDTFMSLNQMIS